MYSNILLRDLQYYKYIYIYYCVKLQLLWVEQNPVIPNINSGATIILYTLLVHKNCIYYIIYCTHIWKKYMCEICVWKNVCITGLTWAENRSDMDCE